MSGRASIPRGVVDRCDEEDAAGRGRAERLVGGAQVFHGHVSGLRREAELARDVDDTVIRVIPSSTFVAGVLSTPSRTTKMLKPAPSVTRPLVVGQHDVVAAAVVGREQRLFEVKPVVVLDARVDGATRDALGVADDEAHTTLPAARAWAARHRGWRSSRGG